jgi:hypothetical protein
MPMGVLASGSAHARPSAQPPIEASEIFRPMYLQSHLQTSPPTPRKSYPKFRKPRTNFQIFNLKKTKPKIAIHAIHAIHASHPSEHLDYCKHLTLRCLLRCILLLLVYCQNTLNFINILIIRQVNVK